MCILFFSTEPHAKQTQMLRIFFEQMHMHINPGDVVDGVGICWSGAKFRNEWREYRDIIVNAKKNVIRNIINAACKESPYVICAHIRMRLGDSPHAHPLKYPYFYNKQAIQPITHSPFSMAFKGQIEGFTNPVLTAYIRGKIAPKFIHKLKNLSDVELVFYMILSQITKNTARGVEEAIRAVLDWFLRKKIVLVAHIIFMSHRFAIITSRNASPFWVRTSKNNGIAVAIAQIAPDFYKMKKDAMIVAHY